MKKVIITSFVALLLVLLTGCSFNTTSTDVSVVNTTTSPVITTTTQAPTTSIKTTTIDDIFRYYGWEIEGNNYTGWLISDDGNKLEVTSERRNQRIYANLIEEPRSFKITVDIDAEVESAPYIRILEHTVELDSRHGNGNQVYVKGIDNEDWLEATGCKCTVVIERYNSGDINVTVKGSNNAVKTGTYKSSSKSSYVEYGIYAGTALVFRFPDMERKPERYRDTICLPFRYHSVFNCCRYM